jgi:RNA polymerase sigma-70 factor (ECF subfamily)
MTFPEEPTNPDTWTDDELVIAAQDGVTSALEELLGRHRSFVYGTARRLAECAEEADDLVQETMLKAFLNIGKFRREARFSSWLIAIAINAAVSMRRKSGPVHWVYLDELKVSCNQGSAWPLVADVRPTPEQECLRQELRSLLQREMLKLHPKYRFILHARDIDESSIEEIARVLGITHSAAKSRLHRARAMLWESFQRNAHARIHDNRPQLAFSSDQ